MLQIEHGDKVPLPFKQENLSNDSIVATIDEQNDILYLWFGKNCTDVLKRSAMRTAQSIKKSGFAYGQLHIGHDLKDIKVVDESNLKDPEIKNNHTELTSIFKRKFTAKDKYVMEIGAKPQVAPVRQPVEQEVYTEPEPERQIIVPKPVSARKPAPLPEEVSPEPVVQQAPVSREEITSAIDPELAGQVKLGLLSVLLTQKFSSVQLKAVLSSTGMPNYEFLSSGSSLCKVALEGSDLVIQPESEFNGRRDEIISLLKNKVSSLNL